MIGAADILNAGILIVDDKEANIRLLEGMLRVAGYTCVHSTADPARVCELHRRNQYGLILLDLQMPVMDGFEVMEGLKEIEADGFLPVLAITAQPDYKLRALKRGARDFIAKPFDQAELYARVHNVLEIRLLHRAARNYGRVLEETVRELEASREVLRIKTLVEQKKNEQELLLAQETQESLLPRSLPVFENFRLHAFNNPTRYVGGDFYDFLRLSASGEWMGVLADVSGKGMPAALLSSMVLGALHMEFRSGTEPEEVLHRVNRLLCEKSLPSQFVSLFLFMLGPGGAGRFISAGHDPVYLFRAATGELEKLTSDAAVLGLFVPGSWETRPFHLYEGDILVVYSDGLIDAENTEEERFGENRLREVIRRQGPSGGCAVEQGLLQACKEFTGGLPQIDDITLVVVEKRSAGNPEPADAQRHLVT